MSEEKTNLSIGEEKTNPNIGAGKRVALEIGDFFAHTLGIQEIENVNIDHEWDDKKLEARWMFGYKGRRANQRGKVNVLVSVVIVRSADGWIPEKVVVASGLRTNWEEIDLTHFLRRSESIYHSAGRSRLVLLNSLPMAIIDALLGSYALMSSNSYDVEYKYIKHVRHLVHENKYGLKISNPENGVYEIEVSILLGDLWFIAHFNYDPDTREFEPTLVEYEDQDDGWKRYMKSYFHRSSDSHEWIKLLDLDQGYVLYQPGGRDDFSRKMDGYLKEVEDSDGIDLNELFEGKAETVFPFKSPHDDHGEMTSIFVVDLVQAALDF